MCSCYALSLQSRCRCGHWVVIFTMAEHLCCLKVETNKQKIEGSECKIYCITKHKGFQPVCLDAWVFQTFDFNIVYTS